jgi:hypothetical protein
MIIQCNGETRQDNLPSLYRNKKTGMIVFCSCAEFEELGQLCIVLVPDSECDIGEDHMYPLDQRYYGHDNIDTDWERLPAGTELKIIQE